jgi:hypothetical protein
MFFGAALMLLGATLAPAVYFSRADKIQSDLIAEAASRFTLVPTHFGPWQMREEDTLSESALRLLGCSNHICRTYVHEKTGETVGLVILVGPAGPLAVHTPEICMSSREYENVKAAQSIEIDASGQKSQFFSTLFRARTLEGQKLNVYYGWSRDGHLWEAPESPRVTLGPLPVLFKIQVACADTALTSDEPSPGVSFLNDLVPILAH